MKSIVLIAVLLAGCATNSDVEKSVSKDRTMTDMARTALIQEMLTSPDPHVRAKGADAAKEFINPTKKWFPF